MNPKPFIKLTSLLFFIIGLLHLIRLIRGWEAAIGGWSLPMWLSFAALIVAWILAGWGMRLAKR